MVSEGGVDIGKLLGVGTLCSCRCHGVPGKPPTGQMLFSVLQLFISI